MMHLWQKLRQVSKYSFTINNKHSFFNLLSTAKHKQIQERESRQQWRLSRYWAMEWRQGSPKDLSSTSHNTGSQFVHRLNRLKMSPFSRSKVCSMVEEAKQKGATVVVGGQASTVGELHYQ